MIISEDLFGNDGVILFRNNILYVHFNGVCVPLMTPPSQKIKTVLECYSKVKQLLSIVWTLSLGICIKGTYHRYIEYRMLLPDD